MISQDPFLDFVRFWNLDTTRTIKELLKEKKRKKKC